MNLKRIYLPIIFITIIIVSLSYIKKDIRNSQPGAPYTSKDSLKEPVLFAEEVITTPDDEFGGTFTPDGKTCYFSKSVLRFYIDVICYSEFIDGKRVCRHKRQRHPIL